MGFPQHQRESNLIIRFYDYYSGGYPKTDYEIIYIEAELIDHAIHIFKEKFKQDPTEIACQCCGRNFGIREFKNLDEAIEYEANGKTLSEFLKRSDVLLIPAEEVHQRRKSKEKCFDYDRPE